MWQPKEEPARMMPGHHYLKQLGCPLCDYVQTLDHLGTREEMELPRWNWKLRRCPNCQRRGIKSYLVRSNR
jgi:hypothetical protein